jgi:hypothetical protein
VEARDLAPQRLGHRPVHPIRRDRQHAAVVEPAHHEDRLALHLADLAVDVGRGALVEDELALDGPSALLGRGEVQEAEVHWLLQLERIGALEEHQGAGGLHHALGVAAQALAGAPEAFVPVVRIGHPRPLHNSAAPHVQSKIARIRLFTPACLLTGAGWAILPARGE